VQIKMHQIPLLKFQGNNIRPFFEVLLTVHLSIFISVFNQLDAQNLFHNKFYCETNFVHQVG